MPDGSSLPLGGLARRLRRGRSLTIRDAVGPLDDAAVERRLAELGDDGGTARRLDEAADGVLSSIASLSALTDGMALGYIDRLARPVPALTPAAGVQIVSRAYCAHLAVERDPAGFAVAGVPVLGTLPPLKRGHPPQDLLNRTVKASRRDFPAIRAVTPPAWEGFVTLVGARVHRMPQAGDDAGPLAMEVVDGLTRFGWVLRQVDIHYGLEPEPLPG